MLLYVYYSITVQRVNIFVITDYSSKENLTNKMQINEIISNEMLSDFSNLLGTSGMNRYRCWINTFNSRAFTQKRFAIPIDIDYCHSVGTSRKSRESERCVVYTIPLYYYTQSNFIDLSFEIDVCLLLTHELTHARVWLPYIFNGENSILRYSVYRFRIN